MSKSEAPKSEAPKSKRGRSYQMTLEFSTESEFAARNLIQRVIGIGYIEGLKLQGWTLADVTRGVYKAIVSHEEKRRGRKRKL